MTERRRGSKESDTRGKLLSAARDLLVEEGYGAITTRRIGERAGVKYQLVHYYFTSLDELFIELFRTGAEGNLARLEELAAGDVSLRTVWEMNAYANEGATLMTEFAAMANRSPALREELAKYARLFRQRQVRLAEQALARDGLPDDVVPPVVITMLTLGLGQLVALDRAIGFTDGHAELKSWMDGWLEGNVAP